MVGTLTIPQQLIDEINEKLGKDYPSLEAVLVSRDRIEIREKVHDDIAAAFPVRVAPENVTVKAKAAPKKNPAQEAPKTQTEGFGIEPVTEFSGMLDNLQRDTLRCIVNDHPGLLTQTKIGSGVWERTCREVARLADGTFAAFHKWNSAWLSRVCTDYKGPDRLKFKNIDAVLAAIDGCLSEVGYHWKNYGSYWWPRDGKKKSLLEFLVSEGRDGSETSAFTEIYNSINGATYIRGFFPESVREIVDAVTARCRLSSEHLVVAWNVVASLVKWYREHRDELMTTIANRPRLPDAADLLRLLDEWSQSNKFNVHPFLWLLPSHTSWPAFMQWAYRTHGVNLKVKVA